MVRKSLNPKQQNRLTDVKSLEAGRIAWSWDAAYSCCFRTPGAIPENLDQNRVAKKNRGLPEIMARGTGRQSLGWQGQGWFCEGGLPRSTTKSWEPWTRGLESRGSTLL